MNLFCSLSKSELRKFGFVFVFKSAQRVGVSEIESGVFNQWKCAVPVKRGSVSVVLLVGRF